MKKCGYIFGAFDRFCFLHLPCGPNLGSYNSSWLHLWKLRKINIVQSRPNKKMFEGIHQMLSDCVYIPLMINDVFRYILLLINIVYTCIYVYIFICTYQSSKTCFLNFFFNSSDFSSTTHYPPTHTIDHLGPQGNDEVPIHEISSQNHEARWPLASRHLVTLISPP